MVLQIMVLAEGIALVHTGDTMLILTFKPMVGIGRDTQRVIWTIIKSKDNGMRTNSRTSPARVLAHTVAVDKPPPGGLLLVLTGTRNELTNRNSTCSKVRTRFGPLQLELLETLNSLNPCPPLSTQGLQALRH